MNILNEFITNYHNCPFCNYPISISAKDTFEGSSNYYTVNLNKSQLELNITSDYYIDSSIAPNTFSFFISIDILTGKVIQCDNANSFLHLYDLDIHLSKECDCAFRNTSFFYNTISILYDRLSSSFKVHSSYESYAFSTTDGSYSIVNGYSMLYAVFPNSTDILYNKLPFNYFNLNDKEDILSKLNTIRLLS